MMLLHVAVSGVLEQQSYWAAADQAMYEAAGGAEGAFEEQQAMAGAMYALLHGGASMAPIIPARLRGLSDREAARANHERRLFQDAGKKAVSFSSYWAPPAFCLAQLLQLASNAAARMLAGIQDATPGGSPSHHDGSSSSTGPITGSGSSRSTSSGCQGGGLSSSLSEAEHLDRAMFSLANTLPPLLKLAEGWLWNVFRKDSSAVRYDALKGLEAMGIVGFGPRRGRPSQGSDCDSDEEDSSSSSRDEQDMAALYAALQETMPQLTELVEAALRRGLGRKPYGCLAALTCCLWQQMWGSLAALC